jgi:ComF family protein
MIPSSGARWRAALDAVLDCLFPASCGACPQAGRAPLCALCREALEPAPAWGLPGLEEVLAPFEYGGPAALALRALKYEGRPELGPPLGRLLAEAAGPLPSRDLLIPIPLSSRRLARRGYNQARELARGVGPVAPLGALRRIEDRRPQVGLSGQARRENQRGAFRADPRRVEGRRVLLLDDVVSTGATLLAARDALVEAGAREVRALAFARAV